MRVPIRKAGNLPNVRFDPRMTQEKYDELAAKLVHWKKTVHPRLAEEVRRSGQFGDFSENAEYQIAKGKLRGVNARILELNQQINRASIIETPSSKDIVRLGSRVTVEANGLKKTYQILGSAETNPLQGIISHNSPLGAALMGHRAGETVKLELNKKFVEYQIIKIS